MGRVSTPGRSLGIFGGTFDPPHLGHLILAQRALDTLGLERVLFVPAADPPHKRARVVTPAAHRVAMLELALAGNPHFELSRVDLDRPGPHYTADMLSLMHDQFPEAALYFLVGADSLADLLTWRDPARIVARARLGVMQRPCVALDLAPLEAGLPGLTERVTFIEGPLIDISATEIRDCLRAGHSIRYQVPDAVADYIDAHRLY